MASLRLIVAAVTNDALSDQDIAVVEVPSIVNLWASCVTVTDQIGLRLGKVLILDDGPCNIRAAALGLVHISDDQLLFNTLVGPGDLRLPIPAVTTGVTFLLSVEPVVG